MATAIKQTKLWKILKEKFKSNHKALVDISKACDDAEAILTKIPDTFSTYTLHNATHSINVCNLIYDLIGKDNIGNLKPLEVALLILSAFYHDTGMVYTPDEKSTLLNDQDFQEFIQNNPRVFLEVRKNGGDVPDEIAEGYFRLLHTHRMHNIPDLKIEKGPIKQYLSAICISHGSSVDEILSDKTIQSFNKDAADIVFCAILLRLADIMDFDQTRAPDILFDYLKLKDADNASLIKSKKEFMNHKASRGFYFPDKRPNEFNISFTADCDNINIEHDIRTFLNDIDKELDDCRKILNNRAGWWAENHFLPISIIRNITSKDYQYGEYRFTLDHEKAIELFMGDNLYSDKRVFVRELVQNAIDTTMHRKLYEENRRSDYTPRINITSWNDAENYQWFRIDDNGMGMDENKICKYFLKAGNSYYNSDEFIAENIKYKEKKIGNFTPISRFGIGILSCFLSGDKVELSSRSHNASPLRLSMSNNAKYFKLQLKDKEHKADPMPNPLSNENDLYLSNPGTHIAVRINPRKYVEEFDIKAILLEYILYPPVEIYYNGEKLGLTDKEFLDEIKEYKNTVIDFIIPEDAIKLIKENYGISIHQGTKVKIGMVNLGDYVSEQNKYLLKGVVFLKFIYHPHSYVFFSDDFYEDSSENIDTYYLEPESIVVEIFYGKLKFIFRSADKIFLRNNCKLNQKQKKWYENRKYNFKPIDLGIDMRKIKWFRNNHLLDVNLDKLQPSEKIFSSTLIYNGILLERNFEKYRNKEVDVGIIALSYDTFLPELTLDRKNIISFPIEMTSELNLALRKAIASFSLDNVYINRRIVFKDFMDLFKENYYTYSPNPQRRFSDLSNFDGVDSWYEYFLKLGFKKLKRYELYSFIGFSFTKYIFLALIQNKRQIQGYDPKKNEIIISQSDAVKNTIIDSYYPPLFFIPFRDESKIFLEMSNFHNAPMKGASYGGFLNRNNPEVQWLIDHTEDIYDKYPAIFQDFINAVIEGDKDEFVNLWKKLKSLHFK
jgi:hypothetical protein